MKRLPSVIVLLVLGSVPTGAFATVQIGEFLIYKGERCEIESTPLEPYLSENNLRFRPSDTACRRGYIGLWRIEDQQLYLVSLHRPKSESDIRLGKKIPLRQVLKDKKPPILAAWFSDVLRVPQGKKLRCDMGFGWIYERDCYVTVKKGKVVRQRSIDNKGEGATRSRSDLMWVERGGGPVRDDGKWHDARSIGTDAFEEIKESGAQFTSRGIFFRSSTEEPNYLEIPATPTTKLKLIPLRFVRGLRGDERSTIGHRVHVEVKARFEKVGDDYLLKVPSVRSIRPLKPGETMHHPSFKPPNQTLETDVE